jgi:hypothetical protein
MALGLRGFRVVPFLVLVAAFLLVAPNETATAAVACRQQVIDDWSDNGRVDRVYPLECYLEAIEAMPPDIRDYSDASDTIGRALQTALRAKGRTGASPRSALRSLAAAEPVDPSGSATLPLPLVALGAFGATALAAGALGFGARRVRLGRKYPAR